MKKEFTLKFKNKTINCKITPKNIAIALGVIVLLTLGIIFIWYKITHPGKAISSEERHVQRPPYGLVKGDEVVPASLCDVDAVIAYMYESNKTDNVFTGNYGIESVILPQTHHSIRKFEEYVVESLAPLGGDDFPHHVVLGIDPYAAYLQSCASKEYFKKNLEFLSDLAGKYPATAFYVYLPDDNAEKWNSFSADDLSEARLSYIFLVRQFADFPNVHIYYHPYEEWYLYSDSIRTDSGNGIVEEDVYASMMFADISDHDLRYMLTSDNVNTRMDEVIEMAKDYESVRATYTDLSDKKVIFLGDSVFGNYRNGTSVSSFFRDMTGAAVYNLGVGGRSAIYMAQPSSDVGVAFNYLIGKEDATALENACKDLPAYNEMKQAGEDLAGSDGSGFIIIFEYGLNDYFEGSPAAEYKEAMTKLVSEMKSAYPKAEILILSPGYIGVYEEGQTIIKETGDILPAFRDATLDVASETGVPVLRLTDDFGFTQEDVRTYLLGDGVHYNEIGRYQLAQKLARYFK